MSEYRNEANEFAKETRWTFFRFLPIAATIIVIVAIIGFGLNSLGLLGKTVIERKVFENSFQYSEARKMEITTFEAQLEEVNNQLMDTSLDATTRRNLKANAAGIRIQLSAARSR